jgi:hypothetical protein
MGKSGLLFGFVKVYGVEGIEDWLEGVICCGCWVGEKRGETGGESDDRLEETRGRGDAKRKDQKSEVGDQRSKGRRRRAEERL